MDNWDFNNNVYDEGHYADWNNKLGENFTHNIGIHNDMMNRKNIETGGGYQAAVSGMYGEFTIASVFKALPDEYAVLNDILLQEGIRFRKYTYMDMQKYGVTCWELAIKVGKKRYKKVSKDRALNDLASNKRAVYYEVVKKSTQVDHIIVSPYGIFVIETKNHKGWVFGSINNSVWTQVLNGENNWRAYGGHDHYTFYNPVRQNEGHLDTLSKQIKIPMNYMVGMIVFTNPEAYLGNINCNCCYTLDMLYNAILSYNRPLWNMKQRDNIIKRIECMNTSSYSLSKEHTQYVQDIKHRSEINRMYKSMRG